MTNTITKTAAATLAAAFALTGAAFADDALTDNIYAQMDASQAKFSEQVTDQAQERIALLAVANDEADASENLDGYTVASR